MALSNVSKHLNPTTLSDHFNVAGSYFTFAGLFGERKQIGHGRKSVVSYACIFGHVAFNNPASLNTLLSRQIS